MKKGEKKGDFIKFSFIDQWIENLDLTSENMKEVIGHSSDFIIRPIKISDKSDITVYMACIDGLISHEFASDFILKPLVNDVRLISAKDEDTLFNDICNGLIYFPGQQVFSNLRDAIEAVISGNIVLIFDGLKKGCRLRCQGI